MTRFERLCVQGREWINHHLGILELDFEESDKMNKEFDSANAMLDN
ncbi:hypothetical protein EVA_21414, partial [gut metagenome]